MADFKVVAKVIAHNMAVNVWWNTSPNDLPIGTKLYTAPEVEANEPAAWISYDTVTGKERINRMPIQSLQPGVYKHTPLYAAPVAQPAAAAEETSKDAERLDWLDKQIICYDFDETQDGNRWAIEGPYHSVREAIDAAIAAMQVKP